MARRFATNLPRSPAYCKTLILSLSRLVQAGRTDQEIADSLNRERLLWSSLAREDALVATNDLRIAVARDLPHPAM